MRSKGVTGFGPFGHSHSFFGHSQSFFWSQPRTNASHGVLKPSTDIISKTNLVGWINLQKIPTDQGKVHLILLPKTNQQQIFVQVRYVCWGIYESVAKIMKPQQGPSLLPPPAAHKKPILDQISPIIRSDSAIVVSCASYVFFHSPHILAIS